MILLDHSSPWKISFCFFTKYMEYLCFKTNSENMTISLSDVKKQKIRHLFTEILNEDFPVIEKISNPLGKTSSSFPGVQFGRLPYRALKRDWAFKSKKANFKKKMIIYSAGKDEIYWWLYISTAFNVISKGNSEFTIITD